MKTAMGIRRHKAEVRDLLKRNDRDGLLRWSHSERNPLPILTSLTYDGDELLRWRAIEAVGRVAGMQAKSNMERIRDFIRRQLWLMNDESGGVGWHSPELIGEILVNVPALIPEYAALLPSYLREEPFQRGAHLAVFRVASIDPKPFVDSASKLDDSLDDLDPVIRAYAALALRAIRGSLNGDAVRKLKADKRKLPLYDFDSGLLCQVTIDEILGKEQEESRSSA
jgi:hypothetical protein